VAASMRTERHLLCSIEPRERAMNCVVSTVIFGFLVQNDGFQDRCIRLRSGTTPPLLTRQAPPSWSQSLMVCRHRNIRVPFLEVMF